MLYKTITILYYYDNFKQNYTCEHNTLIVTVLATMPSTMSIVKGSKCLSVRLMNSGFSRYPQWPLYSNTPMFSCIGKSEKQRYKLILIYKGIKNICKCTTTDKKEGRRQKQSAICMSDREFGSLVPPSGSPRSKRAVACSYWNPHVSLWGRCDLAAFYCI